MHPMDAAPTPTLRPPGLATALAALYQRLPPTTCARQGRCCGLLPPLAPVEMLAWLAELVSRPSGERAEQVAALVEHFLCNTAQRRPCPWARPGACAVYGQRFLACRAYGLWPAPVYQERAEAAQAAQRAVATAWANLGVHLPEEVLAPGPPYCRQVLLACEEQLATWARDLPAPLLLEACGGDLAYLLARLALGRAGLPGDQGGAD